MKQCDIKRSKHEAHTGETQWDEGIWLGHNRGCNEQLIGTDKGVVRAYTVVRVREEERWQADRIKNMKGVPAQPNPEERGTHIPIMIKVGGTVEEDIEAAEVQIREQEVARRMRLTPRIFNTYGYTEGCVGCSHKSAGLANHDHSEACRKIISEAMDQDEEGRREK